MSNFQRTTKEFTTPNGHKVVMYDYATGGELRKVQALYTDQIKASDLADLSGKSDADAGSFIMRQIPASVIFKAQELLIQMLLLSIDGSTKEEAYDIAMNQLRPEDLKAIVDEVDPYTTGVGETKKKSQESQPTTSQE